MRRLVDVRLVERKRKKKGEDFAFRHERELTNTIQGEE